MPRTYPHGQCTATAKSTGRRCTQPTVEGKRVCHWHGKNSLSGPAHPNYKHGRSSKAYPVRLAQHVEAIKDGDNLLTNENEIVVTRARLRELYDLVEAEATVAWVRRLKTLRDDIIRFTNSNDDARATASLNDLLAAIEAGAADADVWEQIDKQTRLHTRLIRNQSKLLVEKNLMISWQEFHAMLSFITHAIIRHVQDRDILRSLIGELDPYLRRWVPESALGGLPAGKA